MSTTLPDTTASGGLENASTTNGQQKSNLSALRNFIADLFGTTTAALRTVWEAFRLHGGDTLANASLTFAVGSSALTINLKTRAGATPSATDPVLIGQRSATAGNGDFNLRAVTGATSLVVSSGSTLGLGNSDSTPLYVYVIDNAGTEELAISQSWLGPSGIVTTTAEGGAGAADSATTVYSTSARTSVPFRALAKLAAPQATAGTWAAVPTSCQIWPFDPSAASQSDVDTGTDTAKFLNSALNRISLKTLTASTSGTSIDFTSIPSGTRRIKVMFNGVSFNAGCVPMVQIGSGSVDTSGYTGATGDYVPTANFTQFSTGFLIKSGTQNASDNLYGVMTLDLMDSASNLWACAGVFGQAGPGANTSTCGGAKALSGALDRVRITTVAGTATFDAGSVVVSYER